MEHQRELYQQRGYSEDLLPKTETQRNWKAFNYFTLWMGSVHNVPNYVMVAVFLYWAYQHLISCWPLLSAHYLLRRRW